MGSIGNTEGSGVGVFVAVGRTTNPSAGSGVKVAVGGRGVRVGRGVSVMNGVAVAVIVGVGTTWLGVMVGVGCSVGVDSKYGV